MKSKFAKYVDRTLGSVLLFGALTAVAVYFLPLKLAAFCALSATATLVFIAQVVGKKRSGEARLGRAADDMFFEFMFLPATSPAKRLYDGLVRRGEKAKLRGTGVYLGKTAAYPVFSSPVDDGALARLISRAKRYGCDKILVISRSAPTYTLSVDGVTVKSVCGNAAYRLYASLEALPELKYSLKAKRRFWDGYRGALSSDKIIRYAVLSAAFFAIAAIFRFSAVTVVCACVCAALFVASSTAAIVKTLRAKKSQKQ